MHMCTCFINNRSYYHIISNSSVSHSPVIGSYSSSPSSVVFFDDNGNDDGNAAGGGGGGGGGGASVSAGLPRASRPYAAGGYKHVRAAANAVAAAGNVAAAD